jgi:hypothetical protein
MKHRYLEVTFRRGRPLAGYLYLPRAPKAKSARTEDAGSGLRVDYDAHGAPIGIEITAPAAVTVAHVKLLHDPTIPGGIVCPAPCAAALQALQALN